MDPMATEEAVRDQGALTSHPSYTDKDFEGHRAHTFYVGLAIGGVGHRRHPRHRRHRHHHRHHRRTGESGDDSRPITPPAQRVQFILGEEEDEMHESHPLFTEMVELFTEGDESEWRETARWVKFEEDVEEGGNRWSKPHVATLSLHSLFELRSCVLNGTIMLDVEATNLEQIADVMLENMINANQITDDKRDRLKEVLLRRHRHQHERRHDNNKGSRIPLIRSLADIGRVHSSSKGNSNNNASSHGEGMEQSASGTSLIRDNSGVHLHTNNSHPDNICPTASSTDMQQLKGNQHFMKKIPAGAEASNILVAELDFLDRMLCAFVRLSQATFLGNITEVPIPTRFIFALFGPKGHIGQIHEIGRSMATLMSDEVFHDIAYKGKSRQDLLAGVDEFLDAVTVLPPGEWDPSIRIEPPQNIPSQDHRKAPEHKEEVNEEEEEDRIREECGLKRTGRLFGGLINDVKRKVPFYLSDFKDALALQCLASFIFLYFACLTPIITFGGLLGEATENNMAAMESLVSGFVCGFLYALFSGQPLTLLSSTGPVLVFETIAYTFCKEQELNYLSFRLWIGTWTGVILLIMVAMDASAFVCYITRFTEENFACLISLIFIYNAIVKLWEVLHKFPINSNRELYFQDCHCQPFENATNESIWSFNWTMASKEECLENNGRLIGEGCKYEANVFLMCIVTFGLTFCISYGLKEFKTTSFFPTKVRQSINDFAVIIAILSMSLLDYCMDLNTPKLDVPAKFEPTRKDRGWFVYPFGSNPKWTAIAAVIPALLATILIFMDQQITAVIVNRKENKLKKGGGYHLDLFVLAILIIVCSWMGLPWFVAGTVLSVTHVMTLRVESECAAPGEKPQFLGVREQRVTHLAIFIMIGSSVALTPVLRYIPMAVLFGVFLYMGISSLKDLQFFDRILIMFMPVKYQPDYMFLRQIPLLRVHLFTFIQVLCLVALWILKMYKPTSIGFPLLLVVMIAIRKALDFLFTQRELKILDDVMPESTRRKREEEKEKLEEAAAFRKGSQQRIDCNGVLPFQAQAEAQGIQFHESGNLHIPLYTGNIMTIPVENIQHYEGEAGINISEELNKSGVWKQLEKDKPGNGSHVSNHVNNSSHAKKRGNKKDAMNEDERKRLSTMAEEEDEDDNPIMIRIDSPSPNNSKAASPGTMPNVFANQNETSV